MTNRTEVPVANAEKQTPTYQHLAPALRAQDAVKPGEERVMAFVPKKFEITLSDGSRQRIVFEPGNYPIPARFRSHYYLKANGVTFGDEVVEQAKPTLEGGADPEAASKAAEAEAARIAAEKAKAGAAAWPSDEELDKAKHDDLGLILSAHGVSDDDVKSLNSKDSRRTRIREIMAAEAEAAAKAKA